MCYKTMIIFDCVIIIKYIIECGYSFIVHDPSSRIAFLGPSLNSL